MLPADDAILEAEHREWTRYERALQWSTPRATEPSNIPDDPCECGHNRVIYRMHIGCTPGFDWFRCRVCGREWSTEKGNP